MPDIRSEMVQVHVFRRMRDGRVEFLLLKRSSHDDVYPNLWQPVTGMLEAGERASDGARREMLEETGLESAAMCAIPSVGSFYSPRTDTVHLVPAFAAEVAPDADVHLSEEHQAFEWLEHDQASARMVLPSHREAQRVLMEYVLVPGDAAVIVPV